MEILIIDNNIDKSSWGAEDLRRYAAMVPGAVVRVRRGPKIFLGLPVRLIKSLFPVQEHPRSIGLRG